MRDTLFRRVVAFGLVAAALLGCSNGDHAAGIGGTPTRPVQTLPPACSTPAEGCPCASAGEVVDCGELTRTTAGGTSCAMGTRTCDGTAWGACSAGDTRIQAAANLPPGRHVLGQSPAASCAALDPCDPFCMTVIDNPTGLTTDPVAGIAVPDAGADSGVTLIQSAAPTGTTCTSLSLTPSPGTLTVTQFSPVSPSTVQFAAALLPSGCYPTAPPVLWAIDRLDIATISNAGLVTLVTPIAGPIVVSAFAGSLTATATLNVVVAIDDRAAAPNAPTCTSLANCQATFTGATTADTATVLYPYNNTVLPLGLLAPLVQWSTGAVGAATSVKIILRYPATGTPIFQWAQFAAENGQVYLDPPTNSLTAAVAPRFTIPQAVWFAFEQTVNKNRATLLGTGRITIQRKTGATLRTELTDPDAPLILFASDQLRGTVYYQSYGTNFVKNYGMLTGVHQYRYECPAACLDGSGNLIAAANGACPTATRDTCRFGGATLSIVPGATFPTVTAGGNYDGALDGVTNGVGSCRVCHSASSSGSKLVTGRSGSSYSAYFDLTGAPGPLGTNFTNSQLFNWPAIHPNGLYMLNSSGPSATNYGTAPSVPAPGLDGIASGANTLRSLVAATLGNDISPGAMFPSPSPSFRAATPAFNPEGTKLAFNQYAGTVTGLVAPLSGSTHDLAIADFSTANQTFSNFKKLVVVPTSACSATAYGGVTTSDPCTLVWPSFLPSSAGVLYQREIFNDGRVANLAGETHADFGGTRGGCRPTTNNETISVDTVSTRCYNNGSRADLWWVTLATPPVAHALQQASGVVTTGHLTAPGTLNHDATNEPVLSYEPTANPQLIGGYNWMAFTSRRLYGNIATTNPWWSDPRSAPLLTTPTTKKIWISAIDGNPVSNSDPSHPAFYLPGQEYLAGNTKAYWATATCTAGSATLSSANLCNSDLDCCSGSYCSLQTPIPSGGSPLRHCIPTAATDSCFPDGSTTPCTSDAQCCNVGSGSRCAGGTCQKPPPILVYGPGALVRDFQATCPSGSKPAWRLFEWQAKVPAGTSIKFTATTATTLAGLPASPSVLVGTANPPDTTTWTHNAIDIQGAFLAANWESLAFLEVTMALQPSSSGLVAPTLTSWRVQYDCLDGE